MGNYYVVDLDTHETRPIIAPSDPPVTAYATWAPIGEAITFVMENDLYVLDSPTYVPSSLSLDVHNAKVTSFVVFTALPLPYL